MKKINILVLGAGGNVSQSIIKALAITDIPYNLVTACVKSSSIGLYVGDSAYLSPYASENTFLPWLINICRKESIELILTGVEEIIDVLSKNYKMIHAITGAIFIASDYSQLCIGNDKYLTCEWLREHKCNYPKYALPENEEMLRALINEVGFPLIAKPRNGKGSQGISIIHNEEDYNKLDIPQGYIIQEYIGSEESEYTVGCYCNQHGELVDCIILNRRIKYGTTFEATVVYDEAIKNEVIKICIQFIPVGPFNLQFRLSKDGRPVCFEMNVRFSGTTSIRARFGFNDVEALIKEYIFKEPINEFFRIQRGTVYRYWDEFYISEEMKRDLDHTGEVQKVSNYNNFTEGF